MKTLYTMKIVFILISLSLTGYASACSCMQLTRDEKIAQADFYVRVEVLDSGRVSGMLRMYKIRLIATYKSDVNPFIRINDRFIYTQESSSACGTTLQQGRCYNLTGTYHTASVWEGFWRCTLESRMYFTMCDLKETRYRIPLPPYWSSLHLGDLFSTPVPPNPRTTLPAFPRPTTRFPEQRDGQ